MPRPAVRLSLDRLSSVLPDRISGMTSRPMSRDKADTLLLLAACALVMFPQSAHLPAWTIAACIALLGWRGWITFRGNRMPRRWILLPLSAAAMIGVYLTYKTFVGREAGVAMLVLLLAFKLLEMRARRDLFVVVYLGFFLILTNFFHSQSIGTALTMAAAVILMLTAQHSFQYTGACPPLRRRLAHAAGIFGLAVPLTLVLFLLFPRIQGPLWGLPGDAIAARSGISDSMAPGNISKLALSGEIAFRVRFEDALPPRAKLYWRGPVLGHFDGRTWTALQPASNLKPSATVHLRSAPVRYQVTLEPHGRRALFALDFPERAPQIERNRARLVADGQLLTQLPIGERVRYEAVSHLDFALQTDESRIVLRDWLYLPPGFNPATHEYAARLRRQSEDPVTLIDLVLRSLREQKFIYTLEPPPSGQHQVDEFLFSTRAGFCEHYAGAFVVLMRALDIPARVVTGYQGGEMNTVDGFMTVRQSDAHAWAEVWLQNRGWVRIDPTAAVAPDRVQSNLASALPPGMFGGLVRFNDAQSSWMSTLLGLRQNWDAIGNAWNQWVLDYTPTRQRNLLESFGFENVDWRMLTGLMFIVGVAVMAIISIPLLRNRVKADPIDALYRTLCEQLAQHGFERAIYEGPRAYRERLTIARLPLSPEKRAAVARFLELYETVRYGVPQASDALRKKQSSAVFSQLKSLLAQSR